MKKTTFILALLFGAFLVNGQTTIYNADFGNDGDGFDDHSSSNPPASGPVEVGPFGSIPNAWFLSYENTPATDSGGNSFKVVSGKLKSTDWGGQGIFESQLIDVSAMSSVTISAQSVNNSANDNVFTYFYILDNGNRVETANISSINNEVLNYTVPNLDVSANNTLIVGFEFSENGGGQGYETTSFTVTGTLATSDTTVQFNSASTSVAESGGTIDLTIDIQNESSSAATTADVVLTGGTGTAADIDSYTTQTVTFQAGSTTSQTVTLTITDDMIDENDETLVFEIQNVNGGTSASAIGVTQFTLTIEDNDFTPIAVPYTEDFSDCGTVSWTATSVAGNKVWECDDTNGYYQINGFNSGQPLDDQDWLISDTPFAFDGGQNIEVTTSERFGNDINENEEFTLKYSLDYSGGAPSSATWTNLTFDPNNTSAGGGYSTSSITTVDASAITGNAFLAFVYDETQGAASSEHWRVEEVSIVNASTTYTYDNGSWAPANPVGNSTAADNINVVSGTPAFTGDLTINDITVQSGTLDLNTNTITVHGDITGGVMVNADGASLIFAGSTAQTMDIDGAIALDELTINNTAGVTLTDTTISLKGTLHLTAGNLATNDGLTFVYDIANNTAGVVGEVGSGTISGLVNVENYYPAQRAFRFMTPSVDMDGTIYENWQANGATGGGIGFAITGGTTANGFDQSSTNNPSMFTFSNDVNQGWNAVTSTNNSPEAGTPYRVMVRGDRTVSLTTANATATATMVNTTGTLKTGDVVKTYPNTLATTQFVFVGNPYQALVDVGAVLSDVAAAGFKNAMYVWNPQAGSRGAYRLFNYNNNSTIPEDNEVDGLIQPGQAFFLEVLQLGAAISPRITFKESHKVPGNTMYATYSLPQAQVVMNLFKANETSARDGFRIQMDANYNAANDANDFTKLYNMDENIAIVNAGNSYILEQRPMVQDGEVINLEVSNFDTGIYTMDFNLNGLGYINSYLHDAFTNDYITLSNGNQAVTVMFDANQPASMDAARFSLVFSNTTLSMSDDAFAKAVTLYPNPTNDGHFYISGIEQIEGVEVAVVNTLGQQVTGVLPEVIAGIVSVNLSVAPSGVYFVVIKNGRNSVTRRVIKL